MKVAVSSISDNVGHVIDPSGGEFWPGADEGSVKSEDISLPVSSKDDLMQCSRFVMNAAARECQNGLKG
jgi:hypothetical protein